MRRWFYKIDRNWRYHVSLTQCQQRGRRLGTLSRTDGIWVVYQLGNEQWRFRHGQVVGPLTGALFIEWSPDVSPRVKAIYRNAMRADAA